MLERLPRGVALTPAGRALLPEARAAVRAVERGRRARALRARARGRRARDRDGALDGGRRCCRATSASGTSAIPNVGDPAARVPAPRRCSRTRSSRASPTSRSGRCRCARGTGRSRRSAWEEFVVVAPPGDPLAGARRRARSRSSPTASGCSTTRITASPASSRRSAARAGLQPARHGAHVAGRGRGAARGGGRRHRARPRQHRRCPGIDGAVLRLEPRADPRRRRSTRAPSWSPTAAAFVDVLRGGRSGRARTGRVSIQL